MTGSSIGSTSLVLASPDQRDVAADVLPQQLVRLQQVVLVVLLEHADSVRFGERPEMHGGGIDRGRDVHELQVEGASWQLQRPDIAHESDVRVVDGEGELGLVVER